MALAGTALEHSSIGGLSTVSKIVLPNLIDAYHKEYRRGNLVFGVASPIVEATLWREPTRKYLAAFSGGGIFMPGNLLAIQMPLSPQLVSCTQTHDRDRFHRARATWAIVTDDPLRYVLGTGNYTFGGDQLLNCRLLQDNSV